MSLVAVSISHEKNCLPLIKEENEQDKYKLGALEMFRLLFFFLDIFVLKCVFSKGELVIFGGKTIYSVLTG